MSSDQHLPPPQQQAPSTAEDGEEEDAEACSARCSSRQCESDAQLSLSAARIGLGMFTESYFLFEIGLMGPVWEALYPSCYNQDEGDGCQEAAVHASTYVELLGVILGMLVFGFVASHFGRMRGSQWTAGLMAAGGVVMCAASGASLTTQFTVFNVGLAVLALGVGGEYPVASSRAAEHSEATRTKRGLGVLLTFTMQGWGALMNVVVVVILLAATGTGGCSVPTSGNSTTAGNTTANCAGSPGLDLTWRLAYGLGLILIIPLFFARLIRMEESKVYRRHKSSRLERSLSGHFYQNPQHTRWYTFSHSEYRFRLAGASFCWFLWDVCFYSNKLFSGTIAQVLVPNGTLIDLQYFVLINSVCALAGYYIAAFVVDEPWMGRMRLQALGFLGVCILYLTSAYQYTYLTSPDGIVSFQVMYYFASVIGQFTNATTWLLPSELFPTSIRTECHGIAAASGKVGALFATLLFSFGNGGSSVTASAIFLVGGWCAFVGFFVSIFLVPDTGTVTLTGIDERWETLRYGKEYEFGPCMNGEALSWFEVLVSPPPKVIPMSAQQRKESTARLPPPTTEAQRKASASALLGQSGEQQQQQQQQPPPPPQPPPPSGELSQT